MPLPQISYTFIYLKFSERVRIPTRNTKILYVLNIKLQQLSHLNIDEKIVKVPKELQ